MATSVRVNEQMWTTAKGKQSEKEVALVTTRTVKLARKSVSVLYLSK